jgi:RNA recognition motif-containing protein
VPQNSKLYVGNLSFSTTEQELQDAFGAFGNVVDVHVATDRESGRPRGFAFVEMSNEAEAQAAIAGLNERDLGGRTIRVSIARPREDRGGGGGGGGGGGRGGWGGGGGGGGGGRRPRY